MLMIMIVIIGTYPSILLTAGTLHAGLGQHQPLRLSQSACPQQSVNCDAATTQGFWGPFEPSWCNRSVEEDCDFFLLLLFYYHYKYLLWYCRMCYYYDFITLLSTGQTLANDTTCLEVEFERRFNQSVTFPDTQQMEDYARYIIKLERRPKDQVSVIF